MLNSLQRRLDETGSASLHARIAELRRATDRAQYEYRACVLDWGTADSGDYWLIAYGRLIEMGTALSKKLREMSLQLPVSERYEVSADVKMLEDIVASWTGMLRSAMTKAVA